MKKVFSVIICFTIGNCFASEYSKFAEKEFSQRCCRENVRITVKKEHVEICAQEIGGKFIPYMAYGYGDLKSKNCKKQRITYMCLLDCKLTPILSFVAGNQ